MDHDFKVGERIIRCIEHPINQTLITVGDKGTIIEIRQGGMLVQLDCGRMAFFPRPDFFRRLQFKELIEDMNR